MCKIYLLNKASIRTLYWTRLRNQLETLETKNSIQVEWLGSKQAIHKSADEVIRKNKRDRKKKYKNMV